MDTIRNPTQLQSLTAFKSVFDKINECDLEE